MALSATIYKVDVTLSNLDTHNYQDFSLTMAKHPSENVSRMMYRLLVYLLCAHDDLEFTRGLSNTEEPEIWQKGHSGEIIQWIELGLPDSKRVRQASGKSIIVKIFTYHENKSHDWYKKNAKEFSTNQKLEVSYLDVFENGPLDKLVTKSMRLSCVIEDGLVYLGDDEQRVGIKLEKLKVLG